jgi:Flp pilus assembly pilin Flp
MKTQIRRTLRRLNREEGQGMTEYIIIVALIAIAAIGVVTVFGRNIREVFVASTNALGGSTKQSKATNNSSTKSKDLKNMADRSATGD